MVRNVFGCMRPVKTRSACTSAHSDVGDKYYYYYTYRDDSDKTVRMLFIYYGIQTVDSYLSVWMDKPEQTV